MYKEMSKEKIGTILKEAEKYKASSDKKPREHIFVKLNPEEVNKTLYKPQFPSQRTLDLLRGILDDK